MTGAAGHPARDADEAHAINIGLASAFGAYVLWGVLPIYLKSLAAVPALEILAHRIIWSVPFAALIISVRGQWPDVKKAVLTPKVLAPLCGTALVIGVNWFFYVWAVNNDRVLEASLGYYINPLMYVAAGVLLLGEKLRRAQAIAAGIATLGVLILTFGAGVFPWVSLLLAVSFTFYGVMRKTVDVGALPGLFIETSVLAPIALLYFLFLAQSGQSAFVEQGLGIQALLLLAGPVTVIPLVLFALAARRITLTTLGFMQYIGPTMQLTIGLIYGEHFSVYHGICFGLIWFALAVFSVDAVRAAREQIKAKTV